MNNRGCVLWTKEKAIEKAIGKSGPIESGWGYHLMMTLRRCNPELIRDEGIIKQFIVDLCDKIKMTRHGEPLLTRFGSDPKVCGYSVVQFIEESNITFRVLPAEISGHWVEENNKIFLDIFSCVQFDIDPTVEFCKKFFKAEEVEHRYIVRN